MTTLTTEEFRGPVSAVSTKGAPMTLTTREVFRELDALGETPEAVAETLYRAGITGHPANTRECPVSVYLQQRLNVPARVLSDYVVVGDIFGAMMSVVSPIAVVMFLLRFDHGGFPELDCERQAELLARSLADEIETDLITLPELANA